MPRKTAPAPAPAVVLVGGAGTPPWAEALGDGVRMRTAAPDADSAELEAILLGAEVAVMDGGLEAPLSLGRRIHRLAPALQVIVVSAEERLAGLRRSALFTPGLGEPWLVAPADVTPDLIRRAADVARQRRGHARRMERVAAEVESLPPPGALSPVLSDQYLATLLELLPGPVLALDEHDRVVFANPAATSALGVEGIGRRRGPAVEGVLRAETPGLFIELLNESREGVVRRQLELRSDEGGRRTYDVVLAPVPGERPLRALLLHDVTDRVEAHERLEEQAMELEVQAEEMQVQAEDLRHQAEQLAHRTEANRALAAERAAVLDHIADGVIIADADGRIRFMNDAARRIHGTAEVGVEPDAWSRTYGLLTLGGEPSPLDALPLGRALLQDEVVADAEWLVRRPDGSIVHVQGSAAPVVEAEGRRIGAVLTFRDVTESRRQEEEQERLLEERDRALEELREVIRQRSRFYASMSHELRTPINAIIGYNDLLLGEVFGPLPEEHLDPLERSKRAAQHLLELVNDILDLSKVEAGKLNLEAVEVEVPELVADLTATMEILAEANGVDLRFDIDASCDRPLRTDPRRLRQVLTNLVSNAIRYGAGAPVDVGCRSVDGALEVDVRDQGPGIAPERLEAIFDEFVQLENGQTGGTGLGLSIARALTEALGGTLSVVSEVGKGSTFTIRVPPLNMA